MTKNNLLTEQLTYAGDSPTPTHLHLCSYNADHIERLESRNIEELIPKLEEKSIHWIQVHGFKDTESIRRLCQHFEIDFLVMQDILNTEHRSKVEVHPGYNLIILKRLIKTPSNGFQPQQLAIVQGHNYLLTFGEQDTDFLNDIHAALEKNVLKIRQRPSDFLLCVILNSVMAHFTSIISQQEDGLEELEERLVDPEHLHTPGIEEIQQYRRNFRLIKKCVAPVKEEIKGLLYAGNGLFHKETFPYFNDMNDHLLFILQTLDGCREMISSLLDLYTSQNDLRMNDIMKQLTVVSTIFIPLTFLAGIWGMNFQHMPELGWKYGYLMAWGLMLLTSAVVYVYFKRKKWY